MKLVPGKISLRSRIAVLCIVIAVTAVLLVGMFQYLKVSRILLENAGIITRGNLETVAAGLDQQINGVLAFASTFASNTEISSALTRSSPRYTYGDATLISTVFRLVIVTYENVIDSIVVSTDAGKCYIGGNGRDLSTQVIKNRFSLMEEELLRRNWVIRYEAAPMRNSDTMTNVSNVISLYYILRDTVSLERIGVIYISLNPDRLLPPQDDGSDKAILLIDDRNQIVAASPNADISSDLLEQFSLHQDEPSGSFLFKSGSGTSFAVFSSAPVTGWHLVEYVPYQALIGNAHQYMMMLTYILIAAFAAIIILAMYGTRRSLAPLRRLRDSMLAVQQGNYDARVEVETQDEIGELAKTYNLMLDRIKQLIQEIYASESQKREIELHALQMQVNPHFLYNTLNSIYWMAMMHGLDSIVNMVDALVSILRHSLQDFNELTTLREELDTLRQYLYIQNVRFNNGITLDCQVAPALLEERVPRLLLQPMVENAVLHGIRPHGGRGHIQVDVQTKGFLIIDISDDGAGFPTELPFFISYDELTSLLPPSEKSFSIGLNNTHERLRLRFGEAYGLFVRSGHATGTTVRLLLPCSRKAEEPAAGEGEQ